MKGNGVVAKLLFLRSVSEFPLSLYYYLFNYYYYYLCVPQVVLSGTPKNAFNPIEVFCMQSIYCILVSCDLCTYAFDFSFSLL